MSVLVFGRDWNVGLLHDQLGAVGGGRKKGTGRQLRPVFFDA